MAEDSIALTRRRCGLDRLVACLRAITLLLALIVGVLAVLAARA